MINAMRRAVTLAGGAVLLAAAGLAQAQFAPGRDYNILANPQPTDSAGRIEVIEFFWYGCPHCYSLEVPLEAWLKKLPGDVSFRRVPAAFNDNWGAAGRVYYALESLNQLERLHKPLFDAIHKDNLRITSDSALADWLKKNGVEPADYQRAAKSFSVESKLRRAYQMTESYKFDGVPAMAVNGRYVALSSQAKSPERLLEIVDHLIGIARRDAPAAKPAAAAAAKK